MSKRIRVTVTADGKVTIAPEGFAGSECHNATRALEARLGIVTSDTPTPEALESAQSADATVEL